MADNELTVEEIYELRVKAARDTLRRHYTFGATEGAKVFDMARRYATEMPDLKNSSDFWETLSEDKQNRIAQLEVQVERMRGAIDSALIKVSGGLCYFTADAKHGQLRDVQSTLEEALADLPDTSKAVDPK